MLKEYWVNVYLNPLTNSAHPGAKHSNKMLCIQYSLWDDWKPIYRIHVKMDGGYNRYRYNYKRAIDNLNKPIKKPVRLDINYLEKGDWMT